MEDTIKIEKISSDRWYTTMCISGLSVDEMHQILDVSHDVLGEIMRKHGYGSLYDCWHNGYGIYSIRHVGGHLFVEIGNNCD